MCIFVGYGWTPEVIIFKLGLFDNSLNPKVIFIATIPGPLLPYSPWRRWAPALWGCRSWAPGSDLLTRKVRQRNRDCPVCQGGVKHTFSRIHHTRPWLALYWASGTQFLIKRTSECQKRKYDSLTAYSGWPQVSRIYNGVFFLLLKAVAFLIPERSIESTIRKWVSCPGWLSRNTRNSPVSHTEIPSLRLLLVFSQALELWMWAFLSGMCVCVCLSLCALLH